MSDYTTQQIADAIAALQASGASNAEIAQQAAAAGVTVTELAAATGATPAVINQVFADAGVAPAPEAKTIAPVQPTAMAVSNPTPVAPTSNLDQYNSQTQNAVKNAGLDTTMNTVTGGGNLTDIINQGLTPQAVGQYKDASGQMINAAPNTFVVSNPDGSGGALNYFFTVDPKTGATAPINNPAQNLTYTPGSPGGFINGLVSQAGDIIKTVAPIALDIALIANGVDPVTAGAITGSTSAAANGGNVGDILKGGVVGGVSGYAGGAASDYVGAGAPITSGVAGGAASGATGAALTGQDIVKGAATGGIVGGGAGALGLGDIAQNAVDTNADTADINNALKTFNAANPGASPTAQAEFLLTDPDLGSFSAKQVATALGASNPISQAAAVMDETYALNAQESAARANAGSVAPAAPAQPAWTQDLASAYNSKDWSAVDNIIKSNGLTADQIAQTYNITNPSTLANIQDIVTNGAGTSLDTVNVTGTNGSTTTTPGVTGPAVPGTNLNTVTVTAPGGTGVTTPATPAVTGPVIPTVTVTGKTGTDLVGPPTPPVTTPTVIPTVTVTGKTGNDLVGPPTPPVTPVIPTVTVIGSKDPGLVVPKVTPPVVVPPVVVPPVVPPVVPSVPVTPPVVVPPVVPKTTTTTAVTPTTYTPGANETTPFTNGLVNPGLNPGWLAGGPAQPFYNTSSPSQAEFYWGAHPYMMNKGDMASVNNVPNAPATPWGVNNQQMPASYGTNGLPVYTPAPAAPTVNTASQGPGTLQQQLEHAWSTGDYGTVNNLTKQNGLTTTQAQSIWGITPAQAAAHGVNLIAAGSAPKAGVITPGTTTATTAATT